MNRSSDYETWSPTELADWVAHIPGIQGITLSGGDPFDQPIGPLADFLRGVRSTTSLSVMCYTGRTLAQLRREVASNSLQDVLRQIDLLVDGPYVEKLNDGALWRGSSNQRFHYLSPRYAGLQSSLEARLGRPLEIRLNQSDEVEITGIPPLGAMSAIRQALASCDVDLSTAEQPVRGNR